jgi:uncharacterized integral membrane protein
VKYLLWIIFLPLAVVLIVFGVSNRAAVPIDLWPFSLIIEVPLFVLLFGVMLIGVVWGGVATWLRAGATRREARLNARELKSLTFENQRQGRMIESLEADIKARDKQAADISPARTSSARNPDSDGLLKLEKKTS